MIRYLKLNKVFRLVAIINTVWMLISCKDFSASEDRILDETRKAIHSMVTLRDQQNERIIPLIDLEIKKDGNRDTAVYNHLLKVLNRTDRIREFYIINDSLISKEYLLDNNYYKSKIPSIESPRKFLPFKDSTLINSWASNVKNILVNDHAAMIGGSCGFRNYGILIEPSCNVVFQGSPYNASFFLGVMNYPSFHGNYISYNNEKSSAEIKFLPELMSKYGSWKGYLVFRGDTTILEIPYKIIDCK